MNLERQFQIAAIKSQINETNNPEVLRACALSAIDLMEKQREWVEQEIGKAILGNLGRSLRKPGHEQAPDR